MHRVLLLALVLMATPARAIDPAALLATMERADTAGMTALVEAIYREAGISWNDTLRWTLRGHDYTFNYFDPLEQEIVIGSIPAPGEVAAYWQNWSRTLTGGAWQGEAFFADPAEPAALAAFNGFVIALHEAGHAMTYRYDPGHTARHDYEVNCREFYADRLAAAALDDLAEADPRIAALRQRYVEVMVSMNAAIAEQHRYRIDDLSALAADCALIHVEQPTPETLEPYASAYFERQRLLLGAALPTLRDMAETHLFPQLAQFMAQMPYRAASPGYRLRSIGRVADVSPSNGDGSGASAAGFDLEGRLYLADLDYDEASGLATLNYGPPGALRPVVDRQPYPVPVAGLGLVGMAPVSADRAFLVLEEAQGPRSDFALFAADRVGADWQLQRISSVAGMKLAAVLQAPDGRIFVLASDRPARWSFNEGWVAVELDPATLEGKVATPYHGIYGLPLAIADDGDLVTVAYRLLYEFDAEARFDVIAGNHLEGSKDGTDPARTELVDPVAAQLLPDGRLLFLDLGADRQSGTIRELTY